VGADSAPVDREGRVRGVGPRFGGPLIGGPVDGAADWGREGGGGGVPTVGEDKEGALEMEVDCGRDGGGGGGAGELFASAPPCQA
jgi:hypothetical protein